MGESVVLWAGKALTRDEEERARRMVALLERAGEGDAAADLARFLPGSGHGWTPDELELGAHAGPWLSIGGGPEEG
ncbi:MAG TPA: hypothetical protein VFG74_00845 [Miltoncostaeaceae bacterium]|jgi:hypothetical protein|nr:hypothetical protein [Miltoncostaeaceae bacterium]